MFFFFPLDHGRLNEANKSQETKRYRIRLKAGTLKAARLLTGEYKLKA